MKKSPTKDIESFRIITGPMASDKRNGPSGAFMVPIRTPRSAYLAVLKVIVSDGLDWEESGLPLPAWEHVSVSCESRCPTWEEMDAIKRIFWRDDETVIQFHVPREDHRNHHPYCLHLWKPLGIEIPRPPAVTVAPKTSDPGK